MSRLALPAPIPNTRTLVTLGDSQTDLLQPSYRTRPSAKWTEQLAAKLRSAGCPIKGRAFAVSGNTTADGLYRAEFMQRWEVPDLAAIYLGVNDPAILAAPAATASATGGSISISSGTQYVGVAFVSTNSTGQRMLVPSVSAVLMPVGSTGSISIAAYAVVALVTAADAYVTPIAYATAAAAQAAASRSFFFGATLSSSAATVITALPSSGNRLPSVSTQANTQALIKSLKYGVTGLGIGTRTLWVAGQASLPANAPAGARVIVMDDTSATGGMAALVNSTGRARVGGDYSSALAAQQTVWERRTPQGGEAGWGRVAVTGTAPFAGCCSRILVISTNYLNWASGGDNVNVATGNAFTAGTSADAGTTGSYYALYQVVRAQTLAAVNAENVNDTACLYVDLFSYQSALILAGETTQGSNSWHDIASNQHHNVYGHDTLARACWDGMNASRLAWLAALAA